MAEPTIRFEDGAGYERLMGVWSRIAGEIFLALLFFNQSQPVMRI